MQTHGSQHLSQLVQKLEPNTAVAQLLLTEFEVAVQQMPGEL